VATESGPSLSPPPSPPPARVLRSPRPPLPCRLQDSVFRGLQYVPYVSTMPVSRDKEHSRWMWTKKGNKFVEAVYGKNKPLA